MLPRKSSSGSDNAEAVGLAATQAFLSRLDAVKGGQLHQLGVLSEEAKTLARKVLQSTTTTAEQEALRKLEACYEKAGQVAMSATAKLQELAAESQLAQADLRRQSLAGTSAKLQQAVGEIFQAQRSFQDEYKAKRNRQLRMAFAQDSFGAVEKLTERNRSAASTIQDTALLQPGTGDGPLRAATAMMATHEDLNELQKLAESAIQLKSAFEQVELLTNTQGAIINDIATQVSSSRSDTACTRDYLAEADHMQTTFRKRTACLICTVVVLLLVLVGLFYLKHS
jgi:t-SNARE complex subunit (syntaxin)